ncbi:efflux RND transporter periplasmic adaptor subunit [Malikia granosa]|uniref:Efflux transporter periplasmic adaptor subunit n=1 Tax=Malikia granosa TaxID=263067 RepID=A0A2S9K4W4_9BURK|nr:efflux RND transporter periplasmic adaptor subunit [Malikia granosa]PRD65500.1 efflux transporter periplasmic adaptor subunit [Malikia granosa]
MPVIHPASPSRRAQWRATLSALGLAALLAACGDKAAAPAAPGGGMPPPEVGVLSVTPGEVGLVTELPGRLEASRVAQVRARAAGILQQRLFREGSDVKAGQPLFEIDASPYQAAFDSAQASLAKAEANLTQASALAERYRPLAEAKAISQQEFVNAQAAQKQAQADVAVAKAALQTARINLGHTRVTAPIAGRIGRALVTEGALVGQGEATPLAVVQQIDPVYVNFTQSADETLQLRRALESGQLKRAGQDGASVRLLLPDGSEHGRSGKLLFSDLTVDGSSGQVTLRAEVPNPGGQLLPGLYVRVRLEQAKASQAITLPQQAVTRTAQGDSVMVVAEDGSFSPRPVKIGAQQGGRWIVLDGLKAGEQVMVDGFQKLRGAKVVKPVPWQEKAGTPGQPDGKAAAPAEAAGNAAKAPAEPAKAGAGAAR